MKPFSKLKSFTRVRRIKLLRAQVEGLKQAGVSDAFFRRLKLVRGSPKVEKLLKSLPEKERVQVVKLFSKNENVRYNAIFALRDLKSKGSVGVLERVALKDSDASIRALAVRVLGELGSKGSVGVLERVVLKDSDAEVRWYAVLALRDLTSVGSVPLLKRVVLKDSDAVVRVAAGSVLRVLSPSDIRWHRLYEGQDKSFFDSSKGFVRRTFVKDSSRTVLLGGKLVGKAIVRYVSREAFAAWKKALDAGVSVEPILKTKSGRLRVGKGVVEKSKDELKLGRLRVVSEVLGHSVSAFLSSDRNMRLYGGIINKQKEKIFGDLERLNIYHGHAHDQNFCIRWEKDKTGKRFPKVYLIDFDQVVLGNGFL